MEGDGLDIRRISLYGSNQFGQTSTNTHMILRIRGVETNTGTCRAGIDRKTHLGHDLPYWISQELAEWWIQLEIVTLPL